MSRTTTRSITSAGSESAPSPRERSTSARGERSASNPASFSLDTNQYDTALPPMHFHQPPTIAHRRTGSTLKTVMRKIFNRKRQSQADGVEENPNESYYSSPARSSGPIAGKSFLSVPTSTESKRSSPLSEENLQLAETHLSPTSATGGSLPSPGMAPRRRRATLPSVIFSDDESRYAVASAVSDPQEDRPVIPDQERQRIMLQSRRRSRSIGALQDLVVERPMSPPEWPTRIASVPDSVADSKSPPPGGGSSASDHSGRPSTGTTVTSVTRASAAPSIQSDPHADQISLPPNVGNLVRTMQQDDSLTLEQRLNTIEVKMIDLEFAIARMQSNSVADNPHDRDRSSSRRKEDSLPQIRSKPSYLSSLDREESLTPVPSLPAARPTSTSTIRADTLNARTLRPAPSATSLSEYNAISIEQYSALVTLLRREQTARRNLETQVSSLKDDIRHIQRAALHSMENGGTMYPIHSVDSQEFLRFRRALDESDSSSPVRAGEDKGNTAFETESDYDPFGPPKWERERDRDRERELELGNGHGHAGRRVVTAPMI